MRSHSSSGSVSQVKLALLVSGSVATTPLARFNTVGAAEDALLARFDASSAGAATTPLATRLAGGDATATGSASAGRFVGLDEVAIAATAAAAADGTVAM